MDMLPHNLCTIVKLKIAVTEHSASYVTDLFPKNPYLANARLDRIHP